MHCNTSKYNDKEQAGSFGKFTSVRTNQRSFYRQKSLNVRLLVLSAVLLIKIFFEMSSKLCFFLCFSMHPLLLLEPKNALTEKLF